MPYVAERHGDLIKSFEVEEGEWGKMKKRSYRKDYFFCPELDSKGNPCNVPLIPKTYLETGTQFFTHKSEHKCIQRDKDDLHKELEYLILKIVHEMGVEVKMDNEVLIPYKNTYRRPDILINQDGFLTSLEIQLSRQTKKDYIRRTDEYKSAGIDQVIWIGFAYRDSLNDQPFVRLVCPRSGPGYKRSKVVKLIEEEKPIPLKILGLNRNTVLTEFLENILDGTLEWTTCEYQEEMARADQENVFHWCEEETCYKEWERYQRRKGFLD